MSEDQKYDDLLRSHFWIKDTESNSWNRSVEVENEGFKFNFPVTISLNKNKWSFKASYIRTGIRSNSFNMFSFDSNDLMNGYSKMTSKIRKFAKNIGLDASKIYEFDL